MIPISKAIRIIERQATPLASERIPIAESINRILAEDITADTDLPPFNRSQMDGYAVKAADTENTPAALTIVGESAAGRGWHKTLKKGEAVRIMTGAPVPKGADAVQKVELTNEENGLVTVYESTETGRFIIKKGAEIKKGKTVLKKGELLTPANITIPAAFGYAKVKVAKRPRVAIFSTGTEIVEINKQPKQDQIRNSNSLMLATLCRAAGADARIFPIVGDDVSDLKSQISTAINSADILITTGGVSVGRYDLTKLALEELGAEIFFDKVALKPGKRTVFGKLKKAFVFGLPGNPVSAAVTFQLFVRLLIKKIQGASAAGPEIDFAVCLSAIKSNKERDSYLPAQLCIGIGTGSRTGVNPLRWQGSSDFVSFARADALIFVPKGKSVESGDDVEIIRL
jgi:molybdopterin molybdotransferase